MDEISTVVVGVDGNARSRVLAAGPLPAHCTRASEGAVRSAPPGPVGLPATCPVTALLAKA